MCGPPVLLLDLINHLIPLAHYKRYPPLKGGFMVDLIHYGVLCQLDRVTVLQVF